MALLAGRRHARGVNLSPPVTGWRDILGRPRDAPAVRAAFAGFADGELGQIGDSRYLSFEDDGASVVLLEDMTVDAIQMASLTRP